MHDAVEQIRGEVVCQPRLQARERLGFEPRSIDGGELPDERHDGGVCDPGHGSAKLAGNRDPRIEVLQEEEALVAMLFGL